MSESETKKTSGAVISVAKCEALSEIVKLINEKSKELNINSEIFGLGVSRSLLQIYEPLF